MQFQTLDLSAGEIGERLDSVLSEKLGISRSQIQVMMEGGHVLVNKAKPKKAGQKIKDGDSVYYRLPEVREASLNAQDIPLDIIFENSDLLVINKDPGIVVHPDESGHEDGTIVNAVLAHCDDLSGIGGEKRPGIVHRLDKDTSGVLLIAKSDEMHQKLNKAFQDRKVEKIYWALVKGCPKSTEGRIEAPIKRSHQDRKKMAIHAQGKMAVSQFKLLEQFEGVSLLEIQIETGRTHQIRVHMASIGHPVVGDEVYGDQKLNKQFRKLGLERQFLHAKKLSVFGESFEADLKTDLEELLKHLS